MRHRSGSSVICIVGVQKSNKINTNPALAWAERADSQVRRKQHHSSADLSKQVVLGERAAQHSSFCLMVFSAEAAISLSKDWPFLIFASFGSLICCARNFCVCKYGILVFVWAWGVFNLFFLIWAHVELQKSCLLLSMGAGSVCGSSNMNHEHSGISSPLQHWHTTHF